jgi:hypothetical protein
VRLRVLGARQLHLLLMLLLHLLLLCCCPPRCCSPCRSLNPKNHIYVLSITHPVGLHAELAPDFGLDLDARALSCLN